MLNVLLLCRRSTPLGGLIACLSIAAGCAADARETESSALVAGAALESKSASPALGPALSASAAPKERDPLAGESMMEVVRDLASERFEGRRAGSEHELAASVYIEERLDLAGVDPLLGKRHLGFSFEGKRSANVVGVIRPSKLGLGRAIVIGAHYDHLGRRGGVLFPGAEDNASGVAMLLGLTAALLPRREELPRPIIVVFFGAEEAGLFGSRDFVSRWDHANAPISAMVNLDMVGRSLVDQPSLWLGASLLGLLPGVDPARAVGVYAGQKTPDLARDIVRRAALLRQGHAVFAEDLPEKLRPMIEDMTRGRGDFAPFEARGIPTLFFSSGESSDYHQPTDTADRIRPEILELRAKIVLDVILTLANELP